MWGLKFINEFGVFVRRQDKFLGGNSSCFAACQDKGFR
jgi:hypothetical protein